MNKILWLGEDMDNKTIQKMRIMGYFVEATNKLLEEEGLDNITIRKVADIAGYNSATIYNYFENLDHLIFFASMKYLKEYVLDLPNFTKDSKNSLDKYLRVWKCFCYHSYKNPLIYSKIFFNKFSSSLKDTITEYYSIFPEELGEESEDLMPMLLNSRINERNKALLTKCVSEGFFKEEDIEEISEMSLLIYQGMLSRLINQQITCSVDEAVEQTLNHFQRCIKSFNV